MKCGDIMFWNTLFDKIGKQSIKYCRQNQVYALLENAKTGRLEQVFLTIKYDAKGHPYFIRECNSDGK